MSDLAITLATRLCLECGLCCNGVLFRDVELQARDDLKLLREAGLSPKQFKHKCSVPQPCVALGADCRCQIYAQRPTRCRTFECLLFQETTAGKVAVPDALRTIRKARRKADRVVTLFRELGDHHESLPLSRRFQRLEARLQRAGFSEASADTFGQLTLAVHELNVLLQSAFYP